MNQKFCHIMAHHLKKLWILVWKSTGYTTLHGISTMSYRSCEPGDEIRLIFLWSYPNSSFCSYLLQVARIQSRIVILLLDTIGYEPFISARILIPPVEHQRNVASRFTRARVCIGYEQIVSDMSCFVVYPVCPALNWSINFWFIFEAMYLTWCLLKKKTDILMKFILIHPT